MYKFVDSIRASLYLPFDVKIAVFTAIELQIWMTTNSDFA